MQISTVLLFFCITILCVTSQEITVRRDEEWPPAVFAQTLSEISKVCKERTGATDEMVTRFSDKDIHDHPNLKCYMKCYMMEMKAMDAEGNLDAAPAMDLVVKLERWAQKIFISMAAKCVRLKYPKDIDLCEKAFILHKCLKEADPVRDQWKLSQVAPYMHIKNNVTKNVTKVQQVRSHLAKSLSENQRKLTRR